MGVGGVVVHEGRALLIRRGSPPLQGEWSIPGGMLEVGETLEQGVIRELAEETGLEVSVVELIEVFERIFPGASQRGRLSGRRRAAAVPLRDPRLSVRDARRNAGRGKRRAGIRLGAGRRAREV